MKQWSDKFNGFLHPKIKLRFKVEWIVLFYIIMLMAIYPLFQVVTGKLCTFPNSFAADDVGTVYIGKDREILCVYADGTTREFRIPYYGGGYGMAVEGDVLLICYPNRLDGRQVNLLDGAVEPVMLETPIEVGSQLHTTENGDVYRIKNRLLRYRIERRLADGTWQTVYTMEEHEFYMKLSLMFSYGFGLPVLVLLTLYSAWTQGYFDGKTHGMPWTILIKVTLPPEGGQKEGREKC